MGAEGLIWHYPEAVVRHSLYAECGSTLSAISDRDYPGRDYIKEDIQALDMDSYECSLGGDNDCTVDAVVGICNERQGRAVSVRHLLVELRMDYTNVYNLSFSDIKRKDSHTRDLLRACRDAHATDESLCLLFDKSVVSQAERWLGRIRMEHNAASAWLVLSPAAFCSHINAGNAMPYTPRPETIAAGQRFVTAVSSGSVDVLESEFQKLRDCIYTCRRRYEMGECNYLLACLQDGIGRFDVGAEAADDDLILFEIIKEDIDRLLKSFGGWINE